jgi:hypothetical protein
MTLTVSYFCIVAAVMLCSKLLSTRHAGSRLSRELQVERNAARVFILQTNSPLAYMRYVPTSGKKFLFMNLRKHEIMAELC